MYNNILRKPNIFAEMSVLKKALLPFRDTLKNMTHVIKEKKDFTKPKECYRNFSKIARTHVLHAPLTSYLASRISLVLKYYTQVKCTLQKMRANFLPLRP